MNSLIHIVKSTQITPKPKVSYCSQLFRSPSQSNYFKANGSTTGKPCTPNGKTTQQRLRYPLNDYMSFRKGNETHTRSNGDQSVSIYLDSPLPLPNQFKFEVGDFNKFYNVLLKHNKMNQSLILDTIQLQSNREKRFYSALPNPSTIEASNMRVNFEYCQGMLEKIKRRIEYVTKPGRFIKESTTKEEAAASNRSSSMTNPPKSKFYQSDLRSSQSTRALEKRKICLVKEGSKGLEAMAKLRRSIKKISMQNVNVQLKRNIVIDSDKSNEPLSQRSFLETNKSIEYVPPTRRFMMKLNASKTAMRTRSMRTSPFPQPKREKREPRELQIKNIDLASLALDPEPELIQIGPAMLFSLRKKNSIKERAQNAIEAVQLPMKNGLSPRPELQRNGIGFEIESIEDNAKEKDAFARPKLVQSNSTSHRKASKLFSMSQRLNIQKYYRKLHQIEAKTYTYLAEARAYNEQKRRKWHRSSINNEIEQQQSLSLSGRHKVSGDGSQSPTHEKKDRISQQDTPSLTRNSDISALLTRKDKSSEKRLPNSKGELPSEVLLRLGKRPKTKEKDVKYLSKDTDQHEEGSHDAEDKETVLALIEKQKQRKTQESEALKLHQDIYCLINDITMVNSDNQELLDDFKEKIYSLRHFSKEDYMNYLIENSAFINDEIKLLKQSNEQERRINMFIKALNVKRQKIKELHCSKKAKLRIIDGFIDSFQSSALFDNDNLLSGYSFS